jgi:hypothetical protein
MCKCLTGSNVLFWAWQWWLSGYSKTTEGHGIEGSNPLCFRDLGLLFCCQTETVLPARFGISAQTSHPLVTRIITYTITVNLQINTVDVNYIASSQQNVVGGRSVTGWRYERPIFEGVGKWVGADKAPQPLLSSGSRAARVKVTVSGIPTCLSCVTQFTLIMKN